MSMRPKDHLESLFPYFKSALKAPVILRQPTADAAIVADHIKTKKPQTISTSKRAEKLLVLLALATVCLTNPLARIAEHAHPWRILTPRLRMPRLLHRAEYPFGMRHANRETAVRRGHRSNTLRRT